MCHSLESEADKVLGLCSCCVHCFGKCVNVQAAFCICGLIDNFVLMSFGIIAFICF